MQLKNKLKEFNFYIFMKNSGFEQETKSDPKAETLNNVQENYLKIVAEDLPNLNLDEIKKGYILFKEEIKKSLFIDDNWTNCMQQIKLAFKLFMQIQKRFYLEIDKSFTGEKSAFRRKNNKEKKKTY